VAGTRFATVRDAAEMLGVTTEAVRKYEARGILPPALRSPINRYRLWDRRELAAACERLQPRRIDEVAA
jgi:DNA-binding transcriptional MerR regulator